jgi:hypothetical protein
MIWFILGMIIGANFGALMMAVAQMNRPPHLANPGSHMDTKGSTPEPARSERVGDLGRSMA